MPGMQSLKRKCLLPGALVLAAVIAGPETATSQGGGGPAAFYSPSYTDASWAHIFELHRSWGNVVPGAVRSPNGLWCVHPDYQPGQVLLVSANGIAITCTVGDTVNPSHEAQWRSRWVIELSWSAFVALGLNQNNFVESVQVAGVGGADPATNAGSGGGQPTRFFPETGYTVGHGFLDFWRAHGGLPVFGYPLSGEIDDNGVTVQYFERAVFEFHHDKAPGMRVLLRRLGAEAAAHMRDSEPFLPRSADEAQGPHYFSQTGHSIAEEFWTFWVARGGVRIFGYPISTMFQEDGVAVQYFERAVFEWYPDNPSEFRILSRRLGAEALRHRPE